VQDLKGGLPQNFELRKRTIERVESERIITLLLLAFVARFATLHFSTTLASYFGEIWISTPIGTDRQVQGLKGIATKFELKG